MSFLVVHPRLDFFVFFFLFLSLPNFHLSTASILSRFPSASATQYAILPSRRLTQTHEREEWKNSKGSKPQIQNRQECRLRKKRQRRKTLAQMCEQKRMVRAWRGSVTFSSVSSGGVFFFSFFLSSGRSTFCDTLKLTVRTPPPLLGDPRI